MKKEEGRIEEARSMSMELLRECPGWISKQRKDAEERYRQPLTAQPQNGHPAIDPTTLNEKQRLAYDIITSHAQSVETSETGTDFTKSCR